MQVYFIYIMVNFNHIYTCILNVHPYCNVLKFRIQFYIHYFHCCCILKLPICILTLKSSAHSCRHVTAMGTLSFQRSVFLFIQERAIYSLLARRNCVDLKALQVLCSKTCHLLLGYLEVLHNQLFQVCWLSICWKGKL